MTAIIGLDLSLTASGVARIDDEPRCWRVRSKGKSTDTLAQRSNRLARIDEEIRFAIPAGAAIAIESAAHAASTGHHHDRSGLWWLVVNTLVEQDHRVYEFTPTQVKKYATGRGNASKMEVMAAVIKRYPQFDVADDNEADAVVLAAMLARALGQPIEESLPQVNASTLATFRRLT